MEAIWFHSRPKGPIFHWSRWREVQKQEGGGEASGDWCPQPLVREEEEDEELWKQQDLEEEGEMDVSSEQNARLVLGLRLLMVALCLLTGSWLS